MNTVIWWIRRDLRLHDQQALYLAMERAERIVPVFVLDPTLLRSSYVGDKRLAFMFAGLRALDIELQQRGGRLIIRQGKPLDALSALMQECAAELIVAEEDYSPYARHRDVQLASKLPLQLAGAPTAYPPGIILKSDGNPYTVFTPFSKVWRSLPPIKSILSAPDWINVPESIHSHPIPPDPQLQITLAFKAGEREALARLGAFTHGDDAPVYCYGENRNLVGQAGTSQLSPYLRFGMLSARLAAQKAQEAIVSAPTLEARRSAETWLNELIWREFYQNILYHFPSVRQNSFRSELDMISWRNDHGEFSAWCAGKTGYPIVDAGMRELVQTGWMHNRSRMITASFLCKDLLIDWRWGERWFMQHLLDGDPASNNGGWQWTAGTGTDAAPYFRIFNPILQSKKFDLRGEYIRRWIPELQHVPDEFIHEPWRMPSDMQDRIGCKIGKDYPTRIVDHDIVRERTLRAYNQARKKV